jgi:hypothetical protein
MVFNTTFNNISVISWRSVLSVEETRVHGENHGQTWSKWPKIMITDNQKNLCQQKFKKSNFCKHVNHLDIFFTASPIHLSSLFIINIFGLNIKFLISQIFIFVTLFRPIAFPAHKDLNYWVFQSFDFEHAWCRLLQKHVMHNKCSSIC